MASYAQWRTAIDAGDIRRVTWIAGDQPVLADEVIATTRTKLDVGPLDDITLHHGPSYARDVWAAANQFPLTPGANRLVVIHDADTLTDWKPLHAWLARTRTQPGVHLIFSSNSDDLPYQPGTKRTLQPHAAALRAPRGYLVRCTLPAEDDAVSWVRRRADLDPDTARHLLTRTGGNLTAAANTCAKLRLFDTRAGIASVNALVAETPSTELADAIIACDRRTALLRAQGISESDKYQLVALLESRLDLLHTLHRTQIAGQHWRQVQGLNPFLARLYLPHARHYDAASCTKRRKVLAVVDDALRSGAREGVIEILIALW